MSFQRVLSYTIFYADKSSFDGKTDINVYLEDGSKYKFEHLLPDSAHLIVDLLHSEGTLMVESASGQLRIQWDQ